MYNFLYKSPIGDILLVSDGEYLTGLYFTSSKSIDKVKGINENKEVFALTSKWLDKYFNGENPNYLDIPLKLNGSDFCLKVWKILSTIPYGTVTTYGDIAKLIDKRMSSQAVGYAVGHNPISIIIPCHRVIGKNNNLTGYGGGIDKKVKLLEIEGIDTSKMYYKN